MRLYSYIVATDDGFAPCAQGSVCTLAICKPVIRRVAQVGDWVMGTTPKRHGARKLIYLMQVGRIATFADYYRSRMFRRRKDNIYRPICKGKYKQLKNDAHKHKHRRKDLSTDRVLIARRFAYFGRNAHTIRGRLRRLVASTQGHRVFGNRHGEAPDKADNRLIAALVKWVFSQGRGICDKPFAAPGCSNGC